MVTDTLMLWRLSIKLILRKSIDSIAGKKIELFSKDDFYELDGLRETRNYWAHECFAGNCPICFKNGEVKKTEHAQRILFDFKTAVEWDERLTKIIQSLDIQVF